MPPIRITGFTGSVPDCAGEPLMIGSDVAPKPFAYRMIVSPGLAGVERPAYRLVGPMSEPLAWIAVACVPSKTKNEGAVAAALTVVELENDPLLTFTSTLEGSASGGVRTLI